MLHRRTTRSVSTSGKRPVTERLEDRTLFSTFTVTNLADSGSGSLRQALLSANATSGTNAILFASGLHGTITLTSGSLVISNPVAITGPGASLISISGNKAFPIFVLNTNVAATLSNLTLSNAKNSAIQENKGTLTLNSLTVSNSGSGDGGGLFNSGTTTINYCTFSGDSASSAGGTGFYNGGAIDNDGTITITGSVFSNDTSSGEAGGAINNVGTLTIANSSLSNDSTLSSGSSIFNGTGGGISNSGTLNVTNSTFTNDSALSGGGIYSRAGKVTITSGTFVSSVAYDGGGIDVQGGSASVASSTFTDNVSDNGYGGGIFNAGSMTVVNTAFSNNTANGEGGGLGNGVCNQGTLTVESSTVFNNVTIGQSDLSNSSSGTETVIDCTLSGSDPGIVNYGTLHTYDSTIESTAAGIDSGAGTALVDNSVVNQIEGGFSSASGYNYIGQASATGISNGVNGNQVGTSIHPLNPMLYALGHYGGATETMPPLANSPVLNKGSNALIPAGVTTDQRGLPRIVGGTVDIGAVEAQTPVKLAFPFGVAGGVINKAINPVTIVVEDAYGNIATTNDSIVTLSLAGGPSGGKVTGTLTASVTNGVAVFSNLSFNVAGNYQLKIVNGTFTSAISNVFAIAV